MSCYCNELTQANGASGSGELAKAGGHVFAEKNFRKRRICEVCKHNIINPGALCRECKVAVHKSCEAKATPTCTPVSDLSGSTKFMPQKKKGSLHRSRSVEQVMARVMEHHYDFDLTYITERIISVFFLPSLEEQRSRQNLQEVASMLRSKHQDKYLLLNLSEKRHDITRFNQKVQDYGWPDLHAPPLDRICAICKAMETWLTSDPSNVVVLHCKGNKGRTGVIMAAYMHYSKISAGADGALTTLAMRKFCEDKVSTSLQPSQNRYIYYFSGLLSGTIKMNSSPLFLHQILIPSLPNFQTGGGFHPFVKIYQSLQLVYTSGVYDPQSSRARKVCVTLEPALLLKGDIMVKCFHRQSHAAEREVVFRVQFHTCTVHGAKLWFGKTELDLACTDDRFPPDATVEFVFSNGPQKVQGREYLKNDTTIKVDYSTLDAVVRWDSYENFNLHHEDSIENISHTRGPLDGSLYAQVRKQRGPGTTNSAASLNGCLISPSVKSQAASQPLLSAYTSNSSRSSVPPVHLQDTPPSTNYPKRENTDCPTRSAHEEDGVREKTRGKQSDRETAILDDGRLLNSAGFKFWGRGSSKCDDVGWERERGPCLTNTHCPGLCNSIKTHPKSQTLPALWTSTVASPLNKTHTDLCHRHSAHPLPELPWERHPPTPPLPCLHKPYYPYPTPEHADSHSHSLPMSNRLYSGEECNFFHYPGHSPSTHLSHPLLPMSPYREMFFGSSAQSLASPCRECISRREHQSDSVRPFQTLLADQTGNPHWKQGAGALQTREAPPLWESESLWEVVRDSDFWQCKSTIPSFRVCPNQEQPRIMHHRSSCPCTPYQASPADSHESRGYASAYQSGSASPCPASSPSPGRGRLPETLSRSREQQHCEEKTKAAVEDYVSQGKSDSNGPSSTTGLDPDHDYTLIRSSSPTHTEDSVAADSPPQSQVSSTQPEPTTNNNKSTSTVPTDTQTPTFTTYSTQPLSVQSLTLDTKTGVVKVTGAERSKPLHASSYVPVTITPVQVQLNGSAISSDTSHCSKRMTENNSPVSLSSSLSPDSLLGSPEPQSSPQYCSLTNTSGHRLTPDSDSSADKKPPSPLPDGYNTPTFPLASYFYHLLNVPHVPYTGYTAVTIPAFQPPLPEKKRLSSTTGSLNGHNSVQRVSTAPSPTHHVTFSSAVVQQKRESAQSNYKDEADVRINSKFVQDSSKYWYKRGISRNQAIAVLKDKEPGTFLIRDSNSFQGAYGLALKVATHPPGANTTGSKVDPLEQLVRHFLIETGPRGVKIKGCQNESYFGSLSALVFQHSITPISLPCALRIPEKDMIGELQDTQRITNASTAADLLKQGAACNVLYLNSVETESLTGLEAVSKATKCTLALNPPPLATVVHFKVSTQGITLTDSKRRLFFRRHYPINSVTFSSLDPQDKRWTNYDITPSKMFGFVARRTGSTTENVCHLFAEMDPEQPAVAIVTFINKVMLGPQLRR